jgi:hypothetical protein
VAMEGSMMRYAATIGIASSTTGLAGSTTTVAIRRHHWQGMDGHAGGDRDVRGRLALGHGLMSLGEPSGLVGHF